MANIQPLRKTQCPSGKPTNQLDNVYFDTESVKAYWSDRLNLSKLVYEDIFFYFSGIGDHHEQFLASELPITIPHPHPAPPDAKSVLMSF